MIAKNCTMNDLHDALHYVNKMYGQNISFHTLETKGKGIHFRLTVDSSSGPGAKVGHNGRKIRAACWHVHGNFFEALFCPSVAPNAEVKSGPSGLITRHAGNWHDWPLGMGLQASDACNCASRYRP